MWKKIKSGFLYLLFLGFSVLLLLELSYRCYWFDFYGGNLQTLNPIEIFTATEKESILVIGDSFSADQQSYVRHLREVFPQNRIVNSSVPGTCTRQHQLMLRRRVRQFSPKLLIYQLYVGNDLLEWRHPISSPHISRARKIYWWLADRFWVLGYINAKLPHLRQNIYQDLPSGIDPKLSQAYQAERYSQRTKMLFRAEAGLVENSIRLKEGRQQDLEKMTQRIRSMLEDLPTTCPVVIVVLPHCMQLGEPYLQRMQEIGAQVENPAAITADNYPFLQYLQEQLASEKVSVVSPLPRLKVAQQTQAVYYENDPHLNPVGQRILGEMVQEYCQK